MTTLKDILFPKKLKKLLFPDLFKEIIFPKKKVVMSDVSIRWLIRRDIPEILNIESQSFEFPWAEDDFVNCLKQRNIIGMVAEKEEKVIGYLIYQANKRSYRILNLAIHPEFKRQKIGTLLVEKLCKKLSTNSNRRTSVQLEVRETNLAAQLLFKSLNFKAISILRDFYDDTSESAYLMVYGSNVSNPENSFADS